MISKLYGPDGKPMAAGSDRRTSSGAVRESATPPPGVRVEHQEVEKEEGDDVILQDGSLLQLINRKVAVLPTGKRAPVQWMYLGASGLKVQVVIRPPAMKWRHMAIGYVNGRAANTKLVRQIVTAFAEPRREWLEHIRPMGVEGTTTRHLFEMPHDALRDPSTAEGGTDDGA